MKNGIFARSSACLALLSSLTWVLGPAALAAEDDTLLRTVSSGTRSEAEYSNANVEKRLQINVNFVSGVVAPGIYHLPDDTNLLQAISLAGGLGLNADLSEVEVKRRTPDGFKVMNYDLEKIMQSSTETEPLLSHNDTVLIKTHAPTSQALLTTLGIVSSILGIVASGLLIDYTIRNGH